MRQIKESYEHRIQNEQNIDATSLWISLHQDLMDGLLTKDEYDDLGNLIDSILASQAWSNIHERKNN
jgi:hypothetical protein